MNVSIKYVMLIANLLIQNSPPQFCPTERGRCVLLGLNINLQTPIM